MTPVVFSGAWPRPLRRYTQKLVFHRGGSGAKFAPIRSRQGCQKSPGLNSFERKSGKHALLQARGPLELLLSLAEELGHLVQLRISLKPY